jgi:hypothetical protein
MMENPLWRGLVHLFWIMLALSLTFLSFLGLLGFLNPYGGGEMHFMFAYRDDGGSLGMLWVVFVEYLVLVAFISALLRWCRLPLHWRGRAAVVSLVACALWARYPLFPSAGLTFRVQAIVLLLVLPIFAYGIASRAERMRQRRLAMPHR